MTDFSVLDAAGRRRSPATRPGYHAGRPPRNKGMRYPADPPAVDAIVAVMRHTADDRHGWRARAMIVVLWRAGLRIQEALALAEHDLDHRCGSIPAWEGTRRSGRWRGRRRSVRCRSWWQSRTARRTCAASPACGRRPRAPRRPLGQRRCRRAQSRTPSPEAPPSSRQAPARHIPTLSPPARATRANSRSGEPRRPRVRASPRREERPTPLSLSPRSRASRKPSIRRPGWTRSTRPPARDRLPPRFCIRGSSNARGASGLLRSREGALTQRCG
jgi:hypothetical protein